MGIDRDLVAPFAAIGGLSRRFFITTRLQPQMKKYRCLWCMSTANHNIWYFGHVSGHPIVKHRHLPVESSKPARLERILCLSTAPGPRK
jgi:hypothetical protein